MNLCRGLTWRVGACESLSSDPVSTGKEGHPFCVVVPVSALLCRVVKETGQAYRMASNTTYSLLFFKSSCYFFEEKTMMFQGFHACGGDIKVMSCLEYFKTKAVKLRKASRH